MAFESNNFQVAKKYRLPKGEFTVECSVPVEGEVEKIFTISTDVSVGTNEVLAGSVNYTGVIETCVIYMLEGGEVGSTHTSCPFSSKFEDNSIAVGQKPIIRVRVKDYKVDKVANGNVTITYTLEQMGFVVTNQEVKSITSNDEDVSVKKEDMKVVHLIGDRCSSICADIPLTTREPIKKLLLCECQASVKDVEPGLNYVAVSGEIVSRVLYLTENDKFESAYVFENFREEIEIEGTSRESTAEAFAFVKYSDVKAVVDNDEKGARAQISVPVDICALVYNEVDIEVVADLYSTKNEIGVTTESFSMTKNLPSEVVEGKIEGNLVIEDDKPRVDKILFNGGNSVEILNTYQEDDFVKVEGIARTTVVYLNDEESSLNAVEIEIPFVLSDRTNLPENAEVTTTAVITDVDVVVKKGRELFYDAKVKATITMSDDEVSAVISEATLSDEIPERDYAMEIVFGKEGQTLWDIAKYKKVKESLVATQNPDVEFPLTEDKEIILFYQNNKK